MKCFSCPVLHFVVYLAKMWAIYYTLLTYSPLFLKPVLLLSNDMGFDGGGGLYGNMDNDICRWDI